MTGFLRSNARWLAPGFLLTATAAFGQNWFVALFAADIMAAHGLSDGQWGSLYAVATLAAAALLYTRGALADTVPPDRLAPVLALLFALSAAAMALAGSLWLLALAIVGLRFCGQGMFPQVAVTTIGRWFRDGRGRAVAIVTLGLPISEAVFPFVAVALIGGVGWRGTWWMVAAFLALGVAPAAGILFARGRAPRGGGDATEATGMHGRHWTRAEALRHWLLPALLPLMLTPNLIGTVVYFHQAHVGAVKGWTLAQIAQGYPAFSVLGIAASLATGWVCDRWGPERLLPVVLLPMGLGVALLGPGQHIAAWIAALGLIGATFGIATALWGALLPALYGTRHLGAVRALATTGMVLAAAVGPPVTGVLIDRGIDFPAQCPALALWCFALSAAALPVARAVRTIAPQATTTSG
jgi:MFS family permease